jgi:transcriptional regulator with XRE-family HTH domain
MSTWQARIKDLKKAGLTLAEIAERTGLAPSSVGDLATGRTASPRGEAAVLLDRLHSQLCIESASSNRFGAA